MAPRLQALVAATREREVNVRRRRVPRRIDFID
jgi:hypothetical protein